MGLNVSTEKAIAGWEIFVNEDLFHTDNAEAEMIVNVILSDTGWDHEEEKVKIRGIRHYKKMTHYGYGASEYCTQNELDAWVKRGAFDPYPVTHRRRHGKWRAVREF